MYICDENRGKKKKKKLKNHGAYLFKATYSGNFNQLYIFQDYKKKKTYGGIF